MDIRQIQLFLEIVKQGSFTKAAKELHIVQPAVSIAMKKLEEELDLILFNRKDKGIFLTTDGEVFLKHAEKIIREVKSAKSEMEELRGLEKGNVRIGISPMMSAYFFPQIIYDFSKEFPNLNITVLGQGSSQIQRMIQHDELDMGIIAKGSHIEGLELKKFIREEVVACCPPYHDFAKKKSITIEEFALQNLIFYIDGYSLREMFFEIFKKKGLEPKIKFETNLYSIVKSLIQKNLGVSIFLKMAIKEEDKVKAISFTPPLYLDLFIAWKKQAYLSKANRAFIDFCLNHPLVLRN
ncbi:MAG: LysR family transcriptional regulator [Desulfuromonadales bacterium]|nr:LysR family transcriptional regulator [Desulfuromonadales bacterium]